MQEETHEMTGDDAGDFADDGAPLPIHPTDLPVPWRPIEELCAFEPRPEVP